MNFSIKKFLKTAVCTFAAVAITISQATTVSFAADTRTVRVGIFPLGNFHNFDDNKNVYGYDVDYIRKTSEYSHWKLEFVEAQNWANALEMLDNNEIDIVAPAQKTPEREEKYLFSAYSMSTELGAVQTLVSRDDLIYEDFAVMEKLHYGAMENSPLTSAFTDNYCAKAGFTPKITYYSDATSLYEALYNGEVDAVATNIMLGDERVKMIGRYSPSPVYYIARQSDSKLMDELNDAMTDIILENPDFQTELFSEYFSDFSNVRFTLAEQQYIASLPEIKVGFETNHAPLSYVDEKTGEFAGITKDILDKISEISGIKFKYCALPDTDVSYDYLRENEIYVLANVEYNQINSAMNYMRLSSPFLNSEKVLIANSELSFNSESRLEVALATGSGTLQKVIAQTYPNFETTAYATVEECLNAVAKNITDATMQNRYVADCALSNPEYGDLTVIPIKTLSDSLCIATISYGDANSDLGNSIFDGEFLQIVDKAIKQITTDEINDIIITNTNAARYHATMWDIVKKNIVAFIAVAVLIVALIAMLIWRQRTEKAKADVLAQKNTALQEAVNQAEKANNAKSNFLARMSHEIRTPMNAIVGLTTIAKRHENEPEQMDDYLDKISSSSKVLLNIINDVLDMSAIENDKMKIAYSEFDIKKILKNLIDVYYPQCKSKGLELDVCSNIEHETLMGDLLHVQQVMMNLLSNAYKFTESGGRIHVEANEMSVKENQAYIRFIVADNGIGISEEMLSRLFKPFEQENTTIALSKGGSGLGLSITKNLVDMMHGAIKAESEKGKGTTFTVDIPFTCAAGSVVTDEKLKNIRALIVDDDETAVEYTAIILDRIGVKYDIAHTSHQALTMAVSEHEKNSGYDICFIDWKMPEMSGVELTREIRKLFDKKTMIVIVSAYDLSEVQEEAQASGADMYIAKPLFQSTVFNILMNLSGGRFVNESAEPEEYDFSGHRVLIAEDNAMNRDIAIDILEIVNLQVECAEDGKQALDMFLASEPGYYEAILMDIQMPNMDGYEATRAIRRSGHQWAKDIPIYAMTANAFAEDVSASLNSGMNGHISKPIDTDILYQTLANVFAKQR